MLASAACCSAAVLLRRPGYPPDPDPQPAPAESCTIGGSFTATVRDVIPDYCLDDTTPLVAVVTEFQSQPFTVYVGEELGKKLLEEQNGQLSFYRNTP